MTCDGTAIFIFRSGDGRTDGLSGRNIYCVITRDSVPLKPKMIKINYCYIWDFQIDEDSSRGFLGCDNGQWCGKVLTFRGTFLWYPETSVSYRMKMEAAYTVLRNFYILPYH